VKDGESGRRSVRLTCAKRFQERVRTIPVAGAFPQRRQLSHDGVRPRRHLMRALRERERLLRMSLLRAHGPERLQRPRETGVDVQDASELCLRLVEPPEVSKPARIKVAIQEVQRIFLQRPRHGLNGFRDAADRQQIVIAIPKAHVAGDRLARHRKPPLAFRAEPVVPEATSAHSEQRVRLGQRRIDAQRLFFSCTASFRAPA
jgi:hypothetical protein